MFVLREKIQYISQLDAMEKKHLSTSIQANQAEKINLGESLAENLVKSRAESLSQRQP